MQTLHALTIIATTLVRWARCKQCGEGHPADDPRARDHLLASYTVEPGNPPILNVDGHCAQGHAITARLPL
jgi:hypothetical protein